MSIEQQIIRGPSVQKVAKHEAEEMLRKDPRFPKGAVVTLLPGEDGNWTAILARVAGPPPFGDTGTESPDDSQPAPEGPPTDEAPSEDGPPKEEGGDKGGEGKEHGEHGKGGESHMIAQIFDMLSQVTQALGIAGPDAGMGMPPGPDGAMGPPPGPPGPPMPPGPGDGKTHTVHERALKPGEAPPGTTPIGSPSFASVQVPDNHPWAGWIRQGSKVIELEDDLGNDSIATVASELRALGHPYGYQIDNITPFDREGNRRVAARLVRR